MNVARRKCPADGHDSAQMAQRADTVTPSMNILSDRILTAKAGGRELSAEWLVHEPALIESEKFAQPGILKTSETMGVIQPAGLATWRIVP
jgi:hypothetical protein